MNTIQQPAVPSAATAETATAKPVPSATPFGVRRLAALARMAAVAAALSAASNVSAQAATSPTGRWQTIDDRTGKPRAIVRIYEANGSFRGDVEQIFAQPDDPPNPTCARCPEPHRGKPVIGLTVLWDLKQVGRTNGYGSGQILDPKNATVYKCKMWLEDGGKRLDVRGYVGFTGALGRTQKWYRIS